MAVQDAMMPAEERPGSEQTAPVRVSQMKIGSFEFNRRELAGSLGDLGTLLPLATGYMVVNGLNPSGLLVMTGLANVATGLIYRLPLPIEPMKVLAIVAIAQVWTPEKIYAAGLVTGLIWLVLGVSGLMVHVARWTPLTVVWGIQLSLGAMLAVQGIRMVSTGWVLGLASVGILVMLRRNRYAPAPIALVILGIAIVVVQGDANVSAVGLTLPEVTLPNPAEIWPALRDGGLAQIPLTATNAVIATTILIKRYWPDRQVGERRLSLNMGVMNVVLPFFGGMPLCHGAGGLASQYYFGARTGGANVIEGGMEIALGLLLAGSIAGIFVAFPLAVVGGMMVLVGIELTRFARRLRPGWDLAPVAATVAGSLAFNMGVGFVVGVALHHAGRRLVPSSTLGEF